MLPDLQQKNCHSTPCEIQYGYKSFPKVMGFLIKMCPSYFVCPQPVACDIFSNVTEIVSFHLFSAV